MDHESVQATALKVVFDLLHVFGFEAFHMGDPNKYPDNNTPETKDEVTCCQSRLEWNHVSREGVVVFVSLLLLR